MNLIKFIFIFFIFSLLPGQAISTPKTIKPLVELEAIDENTRATFIGVEGNESYKTAKLYNITKDNIIFERKDIFEFPLSDNSNSFFSGGHLADITGEGIKELILLITNPQLGTQIISFSIKPGLKFERLHAPYFIKSKQKSSEALSSETALIYEDKDQELVICFGSPERKIVVVDYRGKLNTKTIAKKFLENNVGPILLRTNDFNNDGLFDLYVLSNGNGKDKEERTYYAPQFNSTETKQVAIKEIIKDVVFIVQQNKAPLKILLLKNETLYVEEWDKFFKTNEQGLEQIIKHSNNSFFILDKKGNIVSFFIDQAEKEIVKKETIKTNFSKTNFSKIEYLVLKNNQIIITHNNNPELIIQSLVENKSTETIKNTKEPEGRQKNKREDIAGEESPATQRVAEEPNQAELKKQTNPMEITTGEGWRSAPAIKTTNRDSLYINVGVSTIINIDLDNNNQFIRLEKTTGPNEMLLDKEQLAFIWEPKEKDIGYNTLEYIITYNTTKEFEVYFENGTEKLKPKEELLQKQESLIIYVNAKPEVKISPTIDFFVQAEHEIIIPIYINDLNNDQTLLLEMYPKNLLNATIEERKFFWKPTKEYFGFNKIDFIVSDGILRDTAQAKVFVDTLKTTITFDKKLITTVNKEFTYSIPTTKNATFNLLEFPENLRISQEGIIHWIPTKPQLGENKTTIEIKEKEETYLYYLNIFVNSPPIISYRPDNIEYVKLNEIFEFSLRSFEDNENQKHFWSILKKPETMTLENTEIYWKANQPDYHLYEVVLTDTIDTDMFSGYIYVNDMPQIISIPPSYIQLGDTLNYQIIVKDANVYSPQGPEIKNDMIYFLSMGPNQMYINQNRARWIPTQEDTGPHQIIIEVYDGLEKTEQNFTLFVNDVPTITSNDQLKVEVGEELHHFVKARDRNNLTALTYGINSSLDNMLMNAKTGEIFWTPQKKDIGEHTIEVSVSDGFDLSKDKQTLTIFVYERPKFLDKTFPEGYAGVEYNHTIHAEDMYGKSIPQIDVFISLENSNFQEIKFNKETNGLKIIPTYEELGTQYVTFELKDNYENKRSESFPIQVLSSPCETTDTLYVEQEEVINKIQKIDKSIVYTSKNEKLNLVASSPAQPDTIFITKYDTTITNITDSIFVTIKEPEKYIKENAKLTKRQKKKAEKAAARKAKKNQKTSQKQKGKQEITKEEKKEPLVIKTQHKNINIINKETVIVEQILLLDSAEIEEENQTPKAKNIPPPKPNTRELGHNIIGIKTPLEDKFKELAVGQKSINKTQKTELDKPEFLDQKMDWSTTINQ